MISSLRHCCFMPLVLLSLSDTDIAVPSEEWQENTSLYPWGCLGAGLLEEDLHTLLTVDIQGSKVTSGFLDIGLFPQIHCIPLGKSRELQRKCNLLIQITLNSSSGGCEAVKENATAQGSLS